MFLKNLAGRSVTSTGTTCPLSNPSVCGLNRAIPDNGCGSNNSLEVNVAVSGQPNSLGTNVVLESVDLITSHTFNGDLRIFLVSPNGVERELINRRGSNFDNFGNPANCPNAVLKLRDGAAAATGITGNNVTGVFAPEQSLAGYNDGSNPNGNWTLRICDAVGGDVGALQYIALNFGCVPPAAIASTTDDCPNGQFTLNVDLNDLGSVSSVNIATSVGDTLFNVSSTGIYQFGAYAFGTPVSVMLLPVNETTCNVALGTFTSTGTTCPLTNPSSCGLNRAIPDNGCGSNNYLEENVAVSGQPNSLGTNVVLESVDLIVSHTWNSDMRIFLVSPNGVERELINRRGGTFNNFGNPANCPNAVLKLRDGAAAAIGITGNNVTGVFAPEQSLAGYNDGSNPNGNWTLRICDAVSSDVGALQYVALNFGCGVPQGTIAGTVPDCDNSQFFLDINVSNLGLSDTVRILANNMIVGSVGNVGMVQVGPFGSGSTVEIVLRSADDPSCESNIGSTSLTCPPINDICANAILIDCDVPVFGTNRNATNTGQPGGFCGTTPGSAGVWYKLVGSGGSMTVSTCNSGTDFDTKLNVYRGSCGATNLICVDGNDDGTDPGCQIGTLNRKSKVTFVTTSDTVYYVLVTGFGIATGDFELTLEGCCEVNIQCPGTQSLVLDANCNGILPDYRGLASAGANGCPLGSIAQTPAPGTIVNGAGAMNVTFTIDDNGNPVECTFTVNKLDNLPPTVQCFDQTITFNGEPIIVLNSADLVEVNDNCGIPTVTLNPSEVTCAQLGQTIPVTVTVTDESDNVIACTSSVTIAGLPCGWSQDPNGINCNNGNSIAFNPMSNIWTATSTNCFSGNPFNSDAMAFAQQTLCGNGSITAQVTGISGTALGWAGVSMRENNSGGAKKAQLLTNLSNFSRREFRTVTGGSAIPQQFLSTNRYWLRLVRSGNQFSMHVSADGVTWFFAGAQNIVMASCIEVGLVLTNYTSNSTVTATFSNVTVVGSGSSLTMGDHASLDQLNQKTTEVTIYPNPAQSEAWIEIDGYTGEDVNISIRDINGRVIYQQGAVHQGSSRQRIDLSGMTSGIYLVEIDRVGIKKTVERLVVIGTR